MANSRVVKIVPLLLALAAPLQAELLATFQTTRGNVVVELQYDKAPQAVANFITLAQGTRTRRHEATGAVTNAPLYAGEKFFRVINNDGFRIAQTGSGTGTNSGGPGYTFKDEFHPALSHVPYVLSMANGGPNTNGSQIFLTGSDAIGELDGVHTVFGLIPDPASRGVIDDIIAAGTNATTIQSVQFARTDPAALAFNEFAQSLPTILRAGGKLAVQPGISSIWNFDPVMVSGDVLHATGSTTLASGSWSKLSISGLHLGLPPVGVNFLLPSVLLDTAASPKAFYHLAVARHPGAVAPSGFGNRTMILLYDGKLLGFQFDAGNTGGPGLYQVGGNSYNFTFSTIDSDSDAHSTVIILQNFNLPNLPNLPAEPNVMRIRVGWDSANAEDIFGHHAIEYFNPFFGWLPYASGSAGITR